MITIIKDNDGTSVDARRQEICLLSTDTKPTNLANASLALEMNTGKVFIYDAQNTTWIEL